MLSPCLALVWLISAGGASLPAEPTLQDAATAPDPVAPVDEVEDARQVLRGDTDSATDLRKAVRTLVTGGHFDLLGKELREVLRTQVRVLIIEEMLLLPDGDSLRILEDVLPLLASEDPALVDMARTYVHEVHLDARTGAEFNQRLSELLVGDAVAEGVLRGAILASGLEPDLAWVPALLGRWEQDPAGPCVADLHQSLRRITLADLPADLKAWQDWHANNRFESREALLEDLYRRQVEHNQALTSRVVRQTIQMLEKARASTLAEYLGAPEAEVRLFVAERLRDKARATNGERDETLEAVKEPLRQRLLGLQQSGTRGPELRDLAHAFALLHAGNTEARDLLLEIFASLEGDAQARRQLLEALLAVCGGKPDPAVANALHGFLDRAQASEVREAIWRVLAQVGAEATLVRVRATLQDGTTASAKEQEAALDAAIQIAASAGAGPLCTGVYEDLCQLLERQADKDGIAAVSRGLAQLSGLVPPESRSRAFALLQGALQASRTDKSRVARYSESLCRLVGLEGRAVVVLKDLLLEQAQVPDSAAVEPLLRRLNDLASRAEPADLEPALEALVVFLPEGGRAALPQTQPARFASQALLEIERRHDDAGLGESLRRQLADLCEAAGRHGWTADFLRELMAQEPPPPEAERPALSWRRAQALMQTLQQAGADARRGQEAFEFLAPLEAAETDLGRRRELLTALVRAAELVGDLAQPGAAAGQRLLDLVDPADASRSALAQRVAHLLLRAGARKQAHDLIGKELNEASSPALDILRARAARYDDAAPEVVASALDRYRALLGTAERPGTLDPAHPEFPSLLLDLAELWLLSERPEQARASLARLPADDQLPPTTMARLQELRQRLEQGAP